MPVFKLPSGDIVEQTEQAVIVSFIEPRCVLCTSPPNDGIHQHITHVFNHDAKSPQDHFCRMYAEKMSEHMALVARSLNLNPKTSAGLTTAADMQNTAICQNEYDDFTVTALITAGVDKNGGRVGDKTDWHEVDGKCSAAKFGTVNIMLFINAKLNPAAMLQALTTCTEAKCAVMQELLAPSVYSNGIATGSGTDGTLIVCNQNADHVLTNAGKHCKLGEIIGKTVISALKEALFRQTDLSPALQHHAIRRMSRFGVLTEDFAAYPQNLIDKLAENSLILTKTSLYVHLLDQFCWGLLSFEETATEAVAICGSLGYKVPDIPTDLDGLCSLWREMFKYQLNQASLNQAKGVI